MTGIGTEAGRVSPHPDVAMTHEVSRGLRVDADDDETTEDDDMDDDDVSDGGAREAADADDVAEASVGVPNQGAPPQRAGAATRPRVVKRADVIRRQDREVMVRAFDARNPESLDEASASRRPTAPDTTAGAAVALPPPPPRRARDAFFLRDDDDDGDSAEEEEEGKEEEEGEKEREGEEAASWGSSSVFIGSLARHGNGNVTENSFSKRNVKR